MSKKFITGHKIIESANYVEVIKNSEKATTGLLGFVTGCLISLLLVSSIPVEGFILIVFCLTIAGILIGDAGYAESIPRQRVERIVKKHNHVKIYYTTAPLPSNHTRKEAQESYHSA